MEEYNESSLVIEIFDLLNMHIVGQIPYKKRLACDIASVYFHGGEPGFEPPRALIIGPTGSGKSEAFNILIDRQKQDKLFLPDFTILLRNVSCVSPAGYRGEEPNDIPVSFVRRCQAEKNKTGKGMLLVDEFDKVIGSSFSDDASFMQRAIYQIMQIFDYQTKNIEMNSGETVVFNPRKICVYAAGACQKLYEEQSEKKAVFGFENAGELYNKQKSMYDKLYEYGFPRELLGRIDKVIILKELSELELKAILVHPDLGIISKKKKEMKSCGIALDVEDSFVSSVIEVAKDYRIGARSLKSIVDGAFSEAKFNALYYNEKKITLSSKDIDEYMSNTADYKREDSCQRLSR